MNSTIATDRLSRDDWIQAAIQQLLNNGIDAVQITRLANTLGVSRGSFYWHFNDRQDLLDALLNEWQALNSDSIRLSLETVDSLSEAVLAFFSLWLDSHRFNAALEQAVRDWARLNPAVLAAVRREDQARIAHISQCFARFGYAEAEALVRARILYFAQIGYYAMHMKESMQDRLSMTELYYTSFTGRKLNRTIAAAFRARFADHHE